MSDAEPLDFREPMSLRAAMVRRALGPGQMTPYWSPDQGHVNPLDDPETQAYVRTFLAHIWKAALDAEHRTRTELAIT